MSSSSLVPRWWFRTPKSGLPPQYQMVGVADPLGGPGFILTFQAELIDYPAPGEESDTLFNVIPAQLLQVQIADLPSLAVCRASGWVEENFTWEPLEPLALAGSDTLS